MESWDRGGGPRFCDGLRQGYGGLAREGPGSPAAMAYHPEEIRRVWCNSQKQKQLAGG